MYSTAKYKNEKHMCYLYDKLGVSDYSEENVENIVNIMKKTTI
jgi:hypothetical protein